MASDRSRELSAVLVAALAHVVVLGLSPRPPLADIWPPRPDHPADAIDIETEPAAPASPAPAPEAEPEPAAASEERPPVVANAIKGASPLTEQPSEPGAEGATEPPSGTPGGPAPPSGGPVPDGPRPSA